MRFGVAASVAATAFGRALSLALPRMPGFTPLTASFTTGSRPDTFRASCRLACSLAAPLLLAACVSMPNGPSVLTFPGTGRSFDQFRFDDGDCRRYSTDSIGGSSAARAQTDSALTSAAVGTAVGVLAGAALGGSSGAATGAGVGLLFGSAAGVGAASTSGYTLQQRYDNAYVQCMYAKGHRVPSSGHLRAASPRFDSSAPVYRAPPPPSAAPPPGAPVLSFPPPPPGYTGLPPTVTGPPPPGSAPGYTPPPRRQ